MQEEIIQSILQDTFPTESISRDDLLELAATFGVKNIPELRSKKEIMEDLKQLLLEEVAAVRKTLKCKVDAQGKLHVFLQDRSGKKEEVDISFLTPKDRCFWYVKKCTGENFPCRYKYTIFQTRDEFTDFLRLKTKGEYKKSELRQRIPNINQQLKDSLKITKRKQVDRRISFSDEKN